MVTIRRREIPAGISDEHISKDQPAHAFTTQDWISKDKPPSRQGVGGDVLDLEENLNKHKIIKT